MGEIGGTVLESPRLRLPDGRRNLTWRIIANAGWVSASAPINIGTGVLQTALLARMLGPDGLGSVALFGAVAALFSGLLKIENAETALVYVTQALTREEKAEAKHIVRYCYIVDLLTSAIAFVAVAFAALVVPRLLNLPPEARGLQVIFGLTLILRSTYSTSNALLRVTQHFAWTFYQSIIYSLIRIGLLVLLFLKGAGLTEVVLLLILFAALDGISLFVMAYLALYREDWYLAPFPSKPWWHVSPEIRRFQLLGYGRSITKRIYSNMDALVLGYLGDPASVGLFRAAKQLTNLVRIPTQALVSSLSPEYSRLWFSNNRTQMRKLVLRFTLFSLLMMGALGIILGIFSAHIIHIVLGDAFMPAREPLLVLVLATILGMAMTPFNTMQTATGRAWPSVVAGIATVVTQTVLMVLLVPTYGAYGAAWATVGGLSASLAIMLPTGVARLREQPGQLEVTHNVSKAG